MKKERGGEKKENDGKSNESIQDTDERVVWN